MQIHCVYKDEVIADMSEEQLNALLAGGVVDEYFSELYGVISIWYNDMQVMFSSDGDLVGGLCSEHILEVKREMNEVSNRLKRKTDKAEKRFEFIYNLTNNNYGKQMKINTPRVCKEEGDVYNIVSWFAYRYNVIETFTNNDILYETEKAYRVTMKCSDSYSDISSYKDIWIPKSLVEKKHIKKVYKKRMFRTRHVQGSPFRRSPNKKTNSQFTQNYY